MKRMVAVVALGLGIALLAAPGSSVAERGRTCVNRYGYGNCVSRPHYWGAGAHASVNAIRWSHWGRARAVGHGRIKYHPGGDGGPGIVKLSGLRRCGSAHAYTRVKIIFVDRPSYSGGYGVGC
jgi:hypothetical protein